MGSHSLSWFQTAIAELQNDLLVLEKLKEIKIALIGLHSTQVGPLARALPLKIIFDCLNSLEKEQVELTCDVLKMFLSSLPPASIFQLYEKEIARALKHPEKCVKETMLHELSRLNGENDVEVLISKQPSFVIDLLELMKDEDLVIAQLAINLLTRIGETECGFKSLISRDAEGFLQILEESSAVYCLRVYQVMLEIGSKSESKLSRLENAGLLRGFGKLLTSDDILGKMAAIEELSKLVTSHHGFKFLTRQNCIHVLAQELVSAPKSPMFSLVAPGLLKFFGCACQLYALDIHKDYPQVLETIILLVHCDDLTIATTAIEAIGFICSSTQGKLLLNQAGDATVMKISKRVGEFISKGQIEWKHRILYALANLLNVEESELNNNEVLYLTQKWFSYLDDNASSATNHMFSLSKNPFPEVKLAAFHVLAKLAKQQWGQIEISKIPGSIDYLLDRSTETDMAALLAKYEIVNVLAESPTSVNVFNETDFSSIIEYKKQGATYAPSNLFVAVEGAD